MIMSPTKARLLLAAHDTVAVVVVCFFLCLGLPRVAYAYVDPSVMTYTIQAIAGVAVALGAIAGVAFRRTRKALFKLLKVDENAHKIVEPRLLRMQADPKSLYGFEISGASDSTKPESKRAAEQSSENPNWWKRLVAAFFISAFLSFTLLFAAPLEIVAGASGSLLFGVDVVWPGLAKLSLVVTLAITVVLTLLRRRAFWIATSLVFAIGVCCYLQALCMNTGLPIADGQTVEWTSYRTIAFGTLAVWIAILVISQIASRKVPRQTTIVAVALSCALIIVQGAGVFSLFNNRSVEMEGYDDTYVMTKKDIYTVSPDNNVIVFVLDTYDTQDIIRLLPDNPDMLDEFTGFTWFQDSVGSFIPTRYGAPFLETGIYPEEDESFKTFIIERWGRSSFLSDIKAQNYSIGIYSDTLGLEHTDEEFRRSWVYDKTVNIYAGVDNLYNESGGIKSLVKCGLYRDFPWVFKPFFWFYTDDINNAMTVRKTVGERADIYSSAYSMDDALWYEQLKDIGLEIDTSGQYDGAYRFIHLIGTHQPYTINENAEYAPGGANLDTQALGSMHAVAEYLKQLKALGLYDQATIIITADHGIWEDWGVRDVSDPIDEPTSPIMLVKQSGHGGEEPLRVSTAPITAYDVLPTVIDAVGGNAESYGRVISDFEEDADRTRYYYATISDGTSDVAVVKLMVDGFALDMDSWHTTDVAWTDIGWQ